MNRITFTVPVICLLAGMLPAQTPDPTRLRNWAAPLYYQPTEDHSQAAKIQDSGRSATQPVGALVFVAVTPCRAVDTRNAAGTLGGPIMGGNTSRTFPLAGTCGLPAGAGAYSLNVTVVPTGVLGYLTIWPTGVNQPVVSTLNAFDGQVTANAAIVPAGTNGAVNVFVEHQTHVIIDVNGYYAPPSGLTLATGSAAAPSLSFSGDNGTGVFSSGAGTVNIATGGTSRLSVRSDGDLDLTGNIRKTGTLFIHNLGTQNTALGSGALAGTPTSQNTALGFQALQSNQSGTNNVAVGYRALASHSTGPGFNVAVGNLALHQDTTGDANVSLGHFTLSSNTTGQFNTALGYVALRDNTGGGNIGIGAFGGTNLTTGNNNIMIGNSGSPAEDNTTRIGAGQTRAFIAGIRGVTTGAANALNVVIDSNGQLGTVSSSRRFKQDIEDMGDNSAGLLRLRPVTFRYKRAYDDGSQPMQYGLIAEEVAEVYPELVARSNDGQVESVQYDKINAMLLNEVQRQHRRIEKLENLLKEMRDRQE